MQRDFDIAWLGTNTHFVLGMFGFSYLIGCRAYLREGLEGLRGSFASFAVAGLLLMVSIVNRGVSFEDLNLGLSLTSDRPESGILAQFHWSKTTGLSGDSGR